MHLPPFHTLGISMQLFAPLAALTPVALYPPTALRDHPSAATVPTSDSIMKHSLRTGVSAVMAVPSFVEAWASVGGGETGYGGVAWMQSLEWVVSLASPVSLL